MNTSKTETEKNHIRIGYQTRVGNVIKYVTALLKEQNFKTLQFSAIGGAIGSLVNAVEVIKILNPGFYQINKISSVAHQTVDSNSNNLIQERLSPKMDVVLTLDKPTDKSEGHQDKYSEEVREKLLAKLNERSQIRQEKSTNEGGFRRGGQRGGRGGDNFRRGGDGFRRGGDGFRGRGRGDGFRGGNRGFEQRGGRGTFRGNRGGDNFRGGNRGFEGKRTFDGERNNDGYVQRGRGGFTQRGGRGFGGDRGGFRGNRDGGFGGERGNRGGFNNNRGFTQRGSGFPRERGNRGGY